MTLNMTAVKRPANAARIVQALNHSQPKHGAPAGPPAVTADRLAMTYPDGTKAVDDVSLVAWPGEIVGVVGPNGAGKSTTLKMLTTLLRPTAGSATVCGHSVAAVGDVRPLLGVALQDVGLDPLMTGRDHFVMQLALYRVQRDRWPGIINDLVARFSLSSFVDRTAGSYSVGMQRRLALALSLVHAPPIVVLDEPTAGLDPRTRRDVWELVRDTKAEGKTIIFSTQYLEEADLLCDRLYVIDRGRVVLSGRPAELKRRLGAGVLCIGTDTAPQRLVALVSDAIGIAGIAREQDATFSPANADTITAVTALCAQHELEIRHLVVETPTLDDVFLHFTGHEPAPSPLSNQRWT